MISPSTWSTSEPSKAGLSTGLIGHDLRAGAGGETRCGASCSSHRAHQGPASLPLPLRRPRRRGARRRRRVHGRDLQRPVGRHGRVDAVRQRAEHRAVGELRGVGRLDGRGARGQPGARRVERRLAGQCPRQHDRRRRHALSQGRRDRDGLRLRGARAHAGRGQLPGVRELLRPDRLQAGDRPHVVRVALRARRRQPPPGLRPVRADLSEAQRRRGGGRAALARGHRADRQRGADDLGRTHERDVRLGQLGERCAEHRRHLQGPRRRRGRHGDPGRRADGLASHPSPTPGAGRPTGASCRAR